MKVSQGMTAELELIVDRTMTADQMGNEGVDAYSTPSLVQHFEMVAMQALGSHMELGEGTVGSMINIRHLAATPVGMKLKLRAELVEIDGRRLVFNLEAHDEKEKVAEGTHDRFVVSMERFLARLAAKQREISP